MINFASDNYSPVHPEIIKALQLANIGPAPSYGNDVYTKQFQEKCKTIFGEESESFIVWNGTAANVLGLSGALLSHQSILCSAYSHIAVDECGAPEKHLGSKLVLVESKDAKLTVEALESHFGRLGDVHAPQPKILSLTQSTEYGTIYTLSELKKLVEFAHSKGLITHMDGARIANAAVSLNLDFREFTTNIGIDIISLGGTKNGLMGADAVVFRNSEISSSFPYIRKQGLHLASKMRYLSAQFLAYFENNLWRTNAAHANQMAKYFEAQLMAFPGIAAINQKVESNALFVSLPKPLISKLQKEFYFYVWNEHKSEVRLMCSFNTTNDEIDAFIKALRN